MNAGCSPQRVRLAHVPNQIANFCGYVRSSRTPPRFRTQYQAKALRCQAMTVSGRTICRLRRQPGHHRDNKTHNSRSERWKRTARQRVLLENRELVAKREDLRLQGGTGSKTGGDQSEKGNEKRAHRDRTRISRMIGTSAFSARTEFSVTPRLASSANCRGTRTVPIPIPGLRNRS